MKQKYDLGKYIQYHSAKKYNQYKNKTTDFFFLVQKGLNGATKDNSCRNLRSWVAVGNLGIRNFDLEKPKLNNNQKNFMTAGFTGLKILQD